MKDYVKIFLLLLFDLSFNYGHTLSKVKLNDHTDVYEVKEDKSSLGIAYPNDEKPTLREIVYYHIIERPYDDTNSKNQVKNETPDVDEARSFTNSHGYQFLDQIEDSKDNDDELINYNSELDKADEDIETTTVIIKAKTEVGADDDDDEKFTDDQNKELADDEDYELLIDSDDNDKTILDVNTVALDVRFGDDHDNRKVLEEPDVKQIKPESRSKREIEYTEAHPKVKRTESFEKEIERQVRTLEKAVNNPPMEKRDYDEQKRKARTYGMSLMADGGVVWNDLNAPRVIYYVGEPTSATSDSKPEEVSDTTTRVTIIESTEDPFGEENNVDESGDENVDAGDLEPKEIEESFDEILNIFEELIKYSTSKPEATVSITDILAENTATETPYKNAGQKNSSSILKPDIKKNTSIEENPETNKETNRKDKNINTNKYKDEESKQQQFVKELMKNKFFWQWIKDSSEAYIEILMKKVDALIKAEVDTQIQHYVKEHKVDISKCNPDEKIKVDVHSTTQKNPISTINVTEKNELAKKHKDKESNDKNIDAPVHIEAKNVYGNTVGNGKVTNIFIFNISKGSDLENVKPLTNGTNGVFEFDNKKPTNEKEDKDEITDDRKDKDKIEFISENITAKPESETNQQDINQISIAEPETERDPIDDEAKDNIIEEATKEENENTMYEGENLLNNEQVTPKDSNDYATTENPSNEVASATEIAKEQTDSAEQTKDLSKKEEHETE